MLWAAATVCLHDEAFLGHMEACISARLQGRPEQTPRPPMGLQAAATCLWALGRLEHMSPGAVRTLAAAVAASLRACDAAEPAMARHGAQAASMAMHACATLACGSAEEAQLLRAGQRTVAAAGKHASPQAVTVALWASVVAEEYSQPETLSALLQVSVTCSPHARPARHCWPPQTHTQGAAVYGAPWGQQRRRVHCYDAHTAG